MIVPALIDVYANTLLSRITVSHGTSTVIILFRFRAFVLSDARAIIFSELESRRAGTQIGSHEIPAIMATIVLVVETFIDILTGAPVFQQDVSFLTDTSVSVSISLANLTAIRGLARVGRNAVSSRIIQGHIAGTFAFVRSNQIPTIVGAFVRIFRALVHVDARACVLQNSISFQASASRSVLGVLAAVRAKIRQKGAILSLSASRIVV